MKPDLHNNTNIKQVFEDREISPSANSWNKLANLLDEQLPVPEQQISIVNKSKTNYKYLLGIAAVLLCVFGFSFWTLNDIDNSQFVNESEIGIVNNEISTPKKVFENEYTNDYQLTNTVKSNQIHKTKMLFQFLTKTAFLFFHLEYAFLTSVFTSADVDSHFLVVQFTGHIH